MTVAVMNMDVLAEKVGAVLQRRHDALANRFQGCDIPKPNLKCVANKAAKSVDIYIYDEIGPWYFGMVSAQGVIQELQSAGQVDQINVHINSPGGDVFEGIGIYNALKKASNNIQVNIDGMAFSAASFIAMVGDQITISENAMMMIHKGWNYCVGNADDMTDNAEFLTQIDGIIAGTYASRSGRTTEEMMSMMAKETWLSAQQALDEGLVTAISPNKASADGSKNTKNTSNRVANIKPSRFRNCPEWAVSALAGITNEVPIQKDINTMSNAQNPATEPVQDTPAAPQAAATTCEPTAAQVATPVAATTLQPVVMSTELQQAPQQPSVVVNVAASQPAPQLDEESIRRDESAKAKKAERARMAEISAICRLAGMPDAANQYIDTDTSPADVQAAMYKIVCARNVPVGPGADTTDTAGVVPQAQVQAAAANAAEAAANAKYEAEWKLIEGSSATFGNTKDQYIAFRKKQDAEKK